MNSAPKSPAFQFYPADYLADERVVLMTLEEEGVYVRLLCYCWIHGSIPSDETALQAIIGKPVNGGSTTLRRVVQAFANHATENGRLVNPRLEKERTKQAEWRAKSSEGGRRSGEARRCKIKHKTKGGSTKGQPARLKGGSTLRSSSPSSLSSSSEKEIIQDKTIISSRFVPPTLAEAKAYCDERQNGIDPERFVAHYERVGWVDNAGNKIKSWKACIVTWEKRNATPRRPTNYLGETPL